jgi:STE24 endopeptidase
VAVGWALAAWKLWDATVPGGLELPRLDPRREFDGAALARAESYEALGRVLTIASQVVVLVVLGIYARRGAAAYLRHSAAGPIGSGFLLGMMGFALVWLAQLPFGLAGVWWARRHDVVEVGYVEYVLGEFFGLGGEFLFVCVALLVTMVIARVLRSTWWVPATGVLVGLALFFAYVGPYLVPELERADRETRSSARALAQREGLPPVPVRVEEVREFTSQPNAYAFGLGDTRRIVLWDTLADDFPQPEVDAVVAHELGHHRHQHILKGLGWFALAALPAAFAVALATRRYGLADPRSIPIALFVVVALGLVTGPLQAASSRRYEAEADWAALQATRDPAAMERLHERFTAEALADPDPPRWFHVLFDSHPTGLERIEMSRAWSRDVGN